MGDRSHKMVIGLRKFLKKLGHLHEGHVQLTTSHLIKIVVLTSFDARDNTFGESAPKLDKFTIVIWALNEDGFGVDPTTQRKLNRIEQMKTLDTKPKELMEKIAIKQADLAKHNKRSHDYKETEKDLKKLENELSDYTELKRDVEFCNNGVKPLLPGQTEVHKTRKQKKQEDEEWKKLKKQFAELKFESTPKKLSSELSKQKAVGYSMMKYLVLVALWDGPNLATNLFSAIGTRVVDIVHEFDHNTIHSNVQRPTFHNRQGSQSSFPRQGSQATFGSPRQGPQTSLGSPRQGPQTSLGSPAPK